MNRICIKKETDELIEFQSGKASLGTLVQNAVNAGYLEDEVEEKYTDDSLEEVILKHELPEDRAAREETEANKTSINHAKQVIIDKYKYKKKPEITADDRIEYYALKMAEEIGIGM